MEKGFKSESYYFYAHSYWYYPIFLVVYFPPLILLVIYLNDLERDFGGSVMAYILLGTTIVHYYITRYIARKYSYYPTRVRFDDKKITVDTFSKDLKVLKKSSRYNLQDIVSFMDLIQFSTSTKVIEENNKKDCEIRIDNRSMVEVHAYTYEK